MRGGVWRSAIAGPDEFITGTEIIGAGIDDIREVDDTCMPGGGNNFLILLYTPAKWGFELTKPVADAKLIIGNLGSLFHDTLDDDGLENAMAWLWVVAIVAGDKGTEFITDTAGVCITTGRDDSELCTTVEVFDCIEPTKVTGVWGRAIASPKVFCIGDGLDDKGEIDDNSWAFGNKFLILLIAFDNWEFGFTAAADTWLMIGDDNGIKDVADWLWIVALTDWAVPTNVTGFEGITIGSPGELVGILTGWYDKEFKGIEETLSINGKCELEFIVVFVTALILLTGASKPDKLPALLMLLCRFEVDTHTYGVCWGIEVALYPIIDPFLFKIFSKVLKTCDWGGWKLFFGIADIDKVLTELWAVELICVGNKDVGWRLWTVKGCNCGTFEILEDGNATSIFLP